MGRPLTAALALALTLGLGAPDDAGAQTKDDTIIYAVQGDIPNWDPPNSVLRESIILGYYAYGS